MIIAIMEYASIFIINPPAHGLTITGQGSGYKKMGYSLTEALQKSPVIGQSHAVIHWNNRSSGDNGDLV